MSALHNLLNVDGPLGAGARRRGGVPRRVGELRFILIACQEIVVGTATVVVGGGGCCICGGSSCVGGRGI